MTIVRLSLRVCAANSLAIPAMNISAGGGAGAGPSLKESRCAGSILPAIRSYSSWAPVWDQRYSGSSLGNWAATPPRSQVTRNMTVRSMGSVQGAATQPGAATRLVANDVTKNLQLISDRPVNVDHDPKTLKLKNPCAPKPLVVMLCWLQARQKHVEKYAKLYTDLGFDVLAVKITPWQLLWPTKGTQLVAHDVVRFLHANTHYDRLFLHGFSVGGYLWGECLVHIDRDMGKYQAILDRTVGQLFDSAADVSEIHIGMPKAIFPKNSKMQSALSKYVIYHMKTFHEPATSHYIRSSQMFHGNPVRTPALFIVSAKDPVGPPSSNGRVRDNWVRNNIDCHFHEFKDTPHVGHYHKYPKVYVNLLMNHLRVVKLIPGEAEKWAEEEQAGDQATGRVRAKL